MTLDRNQVDLPLGQRAVPASNTVELWVSDLTDLPVGDNPVEGSSRARRQALRLRQQFILRLLLGSYLACPGKDVRFDRGTSGKPRLVSRLAKTTGLTFNASHSGQWLAIAIGCDVEVGIDIERQREMSRVSALAKRFLSEPEAERVVGLPEPERSDVFLKLWTRREALVKAMGSSIFTCLKQIQLDPVNGRILNLPSGWRSAQSWSLTAPDLPDSLVGALAAPSGGVRVETFILNCNVSTSGPLI